MKKYRVTVAKGIKLPKASLPKIRKRAGSSNAGKYPDLKPSDFVGQFGGSSKYSYPVNSKKRARAALSYAYNAPDPLGIKKAVYKKYPSLVPKNKKKK